MTRWKTGVAIVALGIVASAPCLYPRLETGRLWHDVIGVDVSGHQGEIEWPSLAAGGIGFAYIKATEGGDFRDKQFQRNWDGARAAGVLPPALDAEHMGPCPRGQTVDVRGEMLAFMNLIEAHYGKRPVVYVTREFDQAYLDGHFETESFWVRNLFWPPAIRKHRWLFWQFHHRGQRRGIGGPVDLDAFRGSASDLAAMAR